MLCQAASAHAVRAAWIGPAGWRISHRNHHANHGHVENDESWHPVSKSLYDEMVRQALLCTRVRAQTQTQLVVPLVWLFASHHPMVPCILPYVHQATSPN